MFWAYMGDCVQEIDGSIDLRPKWGNRTENMGGGVSNITVEPKPLGVSGARGVGRTAWSGPWEMDLLRGLVEEEESGKEKRRMVH